MELQGEVGPGLGRAQIFMAQPHYQDQFKQILGRSVWPGTLNLTVRAAHTSMWSMLRGVASGQRSTEDATTHPEPIRVRGFVREGVSFGGATAFLATLHHDGRSTDVAVLIPDLSRHVDVMEIIAGDFLREAFHLSDGDEVSIHLIMPDGDPPTHR